MKELKEFTVESLEEFIDDSENFGSLSIASRDLKALAKIALAAKQAEVVAYITYKGHLLHAADPKVADHSDPEPLYDAPPLNHTEQHMVKLLRNLVDVVWSEAKESEEVPSTKWADEMIAKVYPVAAPKPESE